MPATRRKLCGQILSHLTGDNTYYVRHNPFPYYSDVYNNQTQADNIVPFSQFATDVAAKNLPNLTYVVPTDATTRTIALRIPTILT